jgi:endonuclease/exonuclease/phosphatase (EEP) superfamily protein YafD
MWLLNGGFNFLPYAWAPFVLLVGGVAVFRRGRKATILACAPLALWGAAMLGSNLLFARADGCAANHGDAGLRVLTANVLYTNDRLDALAADVLRESPDVVVFQELVQDLATFSPELAAAYPYRISTEVPWMTIASRLPLEDTHRVTLRTSEDRARDPLGATVSVGGQSITLLGLHAVPPRDGTSYNEHRAQYEALREAVQQATGPVIVAGDFNATLVSPYFANFLARTGLRIASSERFQGATYHPYSWLGIRIDHVLLSGAQVCGERVIDLSGSDHEGVVVDLRFEGTAETFAGR